MSKPKNDTANAQPKRKKTALIIAIVLLLVALVAAGVLVFRYWSQQNAYQELETYVEVEEDSERGEAFRPQRRLGCVAQDQPRYRRLNLYP